MNAAPQAAADNAADNGWIAPVVAAGVLALGGAAFALRRRKRDEEPDALGFTPAPVLDAPRPATAQPSHDVGHKAFPAAFDLSRYGRHVQAAYRGPTADNPSLSLQRRLKRARFFDQRERLASGNTADAKKRAFTDNGVRMARWFNNEMPVGAEQRHKVAFEPAI